MDVTNYVLSDVRGFLNIESTSTVFDGEIIPHVMSAIGKLSQNGVGSPKMISGETLWSDIISKDMIDNPEVFSMFPLYVMLSARILFDPPPPSTVEHYRTTLDDTLWRLRLAYDTRVKG